MFPDPPLPSLSFRRFPEDPPLGPWRPLERAGRRWSFRFLDEHTGSWAGWLRSRQDTEPLSYVQNGESLRLLTVKRGGVLLLLEILKWGQKMAKGCQGGEGEGMLFWKRSLGPTVL